MSFLERLCFIRPLFLQRQKQSYGFKQSRAIAFVPCWASASVQLSWNVHLKRWVPFHPNEYDGRPHTPFDGESPWEADWPPIAMAIICSGTPCPVQFLPEWRNRSSSWYPAIRQEFFAYTGPHLPRRRHRPRPHRAGRSTLRLRLKRAL